MFGIAQQHVDYQLVIPFASLKSNAIQPGSTVSVYTKIYSEKKPYSSVD
jgi:hypothetical protein